MKTTSAYFLLSGVFDMSSDFIGSQGIFKSGYGFSPKEVMKNTSLSIESKAIYAYLSSYSGAGMSSFPSVDLVCHELGISRQRFNKYRKELEVLGLVTVSQVKNKGVFSHNVYTLNIIPTLQNPTTGKPTTENITSNSNSLNSNNLNTPKVPASGDDTVGKKQSEKEKAQTVLDLFNEVCGHVLPKSIALNAKRQRQIQAVCKLKLANGSSPFADYNKDAWRAYFHMILENPWNTGENPSGWVATIDYATRPDTVIKTLEKKYA